MNHKNNVSRGFTLLEILIVLAILGILSGIVFSFVGPARSNARDANIKSTMSSLYKQATFYFNDDAVGGGAGSYGPQPLSSGTNIPTVSPIGKYIRCDLADSEDINTNMYDDAKVNELVASILALSPGPNLSRCALSNNLESWAIMVYLNDTTNGSYLCADSSGNMKQRFNSNFGSFVKCP